MLARATAASLLAIWLVFLGIEFSENIGLIRNDPDKDRSVEADLVSLGQAIQLPTDNQIGASLTPSGLPGVIHRHLWRSISLERASLRHFRKETQFLKEHFKIHKLHEVFLI